MDNFVTVFFGEFLLLTNITELGMDVKLNRTDTHISHPKKKEKLHFTKTKVLLQIIACVTQLYQNVYGVGFWSDIESSQIFLNISWVFYIAVKFVHMEEERFYVQLV